MSLASIKPTKANRVMDLVEQSGLDVSDWENYAKGPAQAAANPRYCYNWAFYEAGVGVVLNLWFDNMREDDGRVLHHVNYRRQAEENRSAGAKSQWVQRGLELDRTLQAALRENLPVRVIVNAGTREEHGDPERKSSSVTHRLLDPFGWTIVSYDWEGGDCVMVRGLHGAIVR